MANTVSEKKQWTILELINWGNTYLAQKGFDEARLTIELLLAHTLHMQRIQLYTNFDKPLKDDELAQFKSGLQRRLQHEPLQYILGETTFMGLRFAVDPRVLIPRLETEVLVEQTIEQCKIQFAEDGKIFIAEIGTGSGCIAISLAKLLQHVHLLATDISAEALELAQSNAEALCVAEKIQFVQHDIFVESGALYADRCDVLVSNPPYVSANEYEHLQEEIIKFEPPSAVTDHEDGFCFYKQIAGVAKKIIKPEGFVIVEHAYNQAETIQKIFLDAGWKKLQTIRDYSNNARCLLARECTV